MRWKAGPSRLTSTLRQVVPPQVIAWTGKSMGLDVIHVYTLEMRDGKTFVETQDAVEGLLARLLRGPLQKTMNDSLERGLRALKVEAERRTSSWQRPRRGSTGCAQA